MRISLDLDNPFDLDIFRNVVALVSCQMKGRNPNKIILFCVGVTGPPVVYQPSDDPTGRPYYIVLMQCTPLLGGEAMSIPYVSFDEMNGAIPPLAGTNQEPWQFQTVGVSSFGDPTTPCYYKTMTISPDGAQILRHRVSVAPSPDPFGDVPGRTNSAALSVCPDVLVYANSLGLTTPILYVHRVINAGSSPYGPRDLFLQQPF